MNVPSWVVVCHFSRLGCLARGVAKKRNYFYLSSILLGSIVYSIHYMSSKKLIPVLGEL